MRKLALAFALLVGMVGAAEAQCNGNFPAATVCGSINGGAPGPIATSALPGNIINQQTAAYAAVTGDCGATIALGGNAQYQLTVNAASGYSAGCVLIVINNDSLIGSGGHGKIISINGLSYPYGFLYPGQSFIIKNITNTWQFLTPPQRWQLPSGGPAVIYIGGAGAADTNDGLTTLNPKLTTCAAFSQVYGDFAARANSAPGQFLIQLQANDTAGCHFGFQGMQAAISGGTVILDGGGFTLGSTSIVLNDDTLHLFFPGVFVIQNITILHFSTNWGIDLEDGMTLRVGNGVICGTSTTTVDGGCYLSQSGSTVVFNGTSTVVSGNNGSFARCTDGGRVINGGGGFSFSITADLTFGTTIISDHSGDCNFKGSSWNLNGHAITGTRWNANTLGLIDTNTGTPNTAIPGNANGAATTGGIAN